MSTVPTNDRGADLHRREHGRGGFTVIELLVVFGLFAMVVGYAMHTLWYQRRSAEQTNRVADLHEVRRLFTLITRDLERAVVLERPGWACNSSELVFLDGTHRRVSFFVEDEQGNRLSTLEEMRAVPAEQPVHLVRQSLRSATDVETERVSKGVHLGWIRFYRLGRSLLGIRLSVKPREGSLVAGQRQGEEFTASVTLNRQVH